MARMERLKAQVFKNVMERKAQTSQKKTDQRANEIDLKKIMICQRDQDNANKRILISKN